MIATLALAPRSGFDVSAPLAQPESSAASSGRLDGTPRALSMADFRCIAQNGFGDGSNSYAYSAAWYDNHLYVGSNRDIIPMLMMRSPFKITFDAPPTPLPREWTDMDLRGQIWRYSVATGDWTRVYHAPLIPGHEDRMVPQAFGFRGMTVFQGKSDPRPAIYTIPTVGRMVRESVTLRSIDGVNFETLPPPAVPGASETFGSFRAMTAFKGQLFVAPSATRPPPQASRTEGGRKVYVSLVNTSRDSAVLVSSDPAGGEWAFSSPPVFGDPTNASIIDMTPCGDYLYVGTLNVHHGFQLWRTTAEGPPPHRWELVLDRGADRGAYNQAVLSMAEFNGDLYVGTCIQNGGFDRVYQIGPAAGEVLRVRPNGTWDLVVGDPRLTRQGLKVPASGLRSGFNNPLCCYIWRMCAHDGALYVGTCDNSSFMQFAVPNTWPDHVQRMLDPGSMERFMERLGGCELWRTTDGDNWIPVTRNGFGNRYNLGVRALVSTPHGLFAGTANPFGPQVAVRDGERWVYRDNPRGGMEVWLGSHDHPSSPRPAAAQGDAFAEPNPDAYRLATATRTQADIVQDPWLRLSSTPADLAGLGESVDDELQEYFAAGPRNVGWWRNRAVRPAEASRALLHELTAWLPIVSELHGPPPAPARMLLLAAGSDALVDVVKTRWPTCQVDADLDPAALEVCLTTQQGVYDCIVGIEAGSIVPRAALLQRIGQLLAPQGQALLSEFIAPPADGATGSPDAQFEEEAAAAGLSIEALRDVSATTWLPFFDHSRNHWLVKLLLQQLDADKHAEILAALPGGNSGTQRYAFIRLRRPDNR